MIKRKLISGLFSAMALVAIMSQAVTDIRHWGPYEGLPLFAMFLAVYVFPVVFTYGLGVSLVTELALNKIPLSPRISMVLSGAIHVAFGGLFGLITSASGFGIFAMIAAGLFFAVDSWLKLRRPSEKAVGYLFSPFALYAVLLVLSLVLHAFNHDTFTAEEAVKAAASNTSGELAPSLFPDEVGSAKLMIEGYEVTRETTVMSTAMEGYYLVTFKEKWVKEGDSGENSVTYRVWENGLTISGNSGREIPYRRR